MRGLMRVLRFLPLAGLFLAFAGGGVPPVGNAAPTFDPIVYTGKKPQASHVTAAVPWCGTGESATNRAPEVELSSTDQIHVVYAIPSDGADGRGGVAVYGVFGVCGESVVD